jgi:chromate transporter
VIGALVGSVAIIASRSIVDIPTGLIAIIAALILIYTKKIQEPHLILTAALLGIIIKTI